LFPKNEQLKREWLNAIKRSSSDQKHKEWAPNKSSIVCYEHFIESDYTSMTSFGK